MEEKKVFDKSRYDRHHADSKGIVFTKTVKRQEITEDVNPGFV